MTVDASFLSPTRVGLGLASLVLAGLLLLGFSVPKDGVVLTGTAGAVGGGSANGGASNGGTSAASNGGSSSTSGAAASSGTSGSSGSSGASSGTSGSAKSGTYDGSVVDNRYGPVQVEITVSAGKVTTVTAIQLPSGGRSGMISGYVEPILEQEAVQAQSAQIDLVSGATYTSEGFAESLQSALQQAGL